MFGVNINDYDIKLELAECFKGSVYMAQYLPNGHHVVLKKFRLDKASKEDTELLRNEILAIRQFNHPNLHIFYTAFVHRSDLCVVAPLMCFGSCRDIIRNCFTTGFPEILIAFTIRDVLSGVEYLHQRGYIHRSIRGSHILLNQSKAALSGFRSCSSFLSHGGRVTAFHHLAADSEHSLNWLAPEVLEQNLIGYNEKSDMYSIGITCCELANGIEPFADAQPTLMFTEKIRGNIPTLLDHSTCPSADDMIGVLVATKKMDFATASEAQRFYMQRVFSDEFHQFTEICMEKKPDNRWCASKLLSHGFFKQCRNSNLLDVTQQLGMQTSDYDQLRDNTLNNLKYLNDLSTDANNTWTWEF